MELLVLRVNKDMTTEECINHSKALEKHLGVQVLILDKKVVDYDVLNIEKYDGVWIDLDLKPYHYDEQDITTRLTSVPMEDLKTFYSGCNCKESKNDLPKDTTYTPTSSNKTDELFDKIEKILFKQFDK